MTACFRLFVLLSLLLFPIVSEAHVTTSQGAPEKTITVGSELDYPPYALVTEKGEAAGFSVDLIKAACDAMGIHIHFQVGPWNEVRTALEEGRIDALPLVGYSLERDKLFDFTTPHTVAYGGVLKRKNTPDIRSLDDLKNKPLLVMRADNTHDYLIKHSIGSPLLLKETMDEVLKALEAGEAQYAVLPRLVGLLTAMDLGLTNLELTDVRIDAYGPGYAFAVQQGNTELLEKLNQGLSLIKADGTYDKIYHQWFGKIDPQHMDYGAIMRKALIIALVLVGILMLAAISLWALRRQVKLKTQELAELSDRYQDLYDNAPDMFVSVDAKTAEIITCNQRLADTLGYTKKELIGKPIFFVYHPDCQERVEAAFESFVKTGEVRNSELVLKTKDGEKIDVELNVVAVRDRDGEVLYSRSSWRDIRERKHHEKLIRISEARFKILASLSPVGIFHANTEGHFLYVNDKWSTISGLDIEEAKGEGWIQGVYLEDRDWVAEQWTEAAISGSPFYAEYRFQNKQGNITWVLSQASVEKDETGKIIGYVGTITDISKRKEAEQAIKISTDRMNEAQRIAKIGSWELDIESGKLWWSDEVYQIFEQNPDEFEPSYDAFLNALHPDEHEAVNKAYTDSIQNKTPYNIVHRLHMPDGSIKHINEHCETFYDEDGQPVRSFGSVQDITERINIEQERLTLQSQLEHAQRLESLGILAGGIAHDFNNILTAIMGNAALAECKLQSEHSDMKKYLSNIVHSSEKAADLCKQMLAYSGKGKFEVKMIDLSTVVEETSRLLEVSIGKGVILKYHLTEGLPRVEADVAQIQQVIMNLVINASDAIGSKSGVISISTGVMSVDENYLTETSIDDRLPGGRYAYLEVSDTGCGMGKEIQKRLFDPFFTTKFTGHGLGMSAVQGIVRGHNGAIKVYSEPGRGSSFKMLLPANNSLPLDAIAGDDPANALTNRHPRPVGKVLVVDDEETIRETAAMMLESLGYQTMTAVDGLDALEVYKLHQTEVIAVLLDMTMPRMDGKNCFRELRQINPELVVILSSGYNEQEATSLFTGKGLAGFIQKPYTPDQLDKKLDEALDLSS